MLLQIAIVILILWLLGFLALPAVGSIIHLLLVIALVLIILNFLSGKKKF